MSFYEAFEIIKYSKYVDAFERIMMRDLGYFILQPNSKKKIKMDEIIPLPWDKNYDTVSMDKRGFVGDFNTEYLEDYEQKMREFNKKDNETIEKIKSVQFTQLNMTDLFKNTF